jgi:glycosyltransferase 2 family protein
MGRGADNPGVKPTVLERAGTAAAHAGRGDPRRPGLQVALRWGFVVLVLGFLVGFVVTQWDQLPDFDWRFRPGWLALAAVGVALFYVIQAEAWHAIVRGLGAELPATSARAVWGKSLIARYVPTNALMVVGRVMMAERLGVSRRVCVASMMYELGLALCAAMVVGAYFVITMPALEDVPVRYAVLLVVPAVLVTLHPRVFRRVGDYILRKLGRDPLPSTLSAARVGVLLVIYVLSWVAVGSGVFAFASALHPVDLEDFPYVAAAQAVAFGVAVVTFIAPSGLGTRDAALAAALAVVLPLAVAGAIAVAFRLFQTAVELAFVGAVAWAGRRGDRGPPGSAVVRRSPGVVAPKGG